MRQNEFYIDGTPTNGASFLRILKAALTGNRRVKIVSRIETKTVFHYLTTATEKGGIR